MQPQSNLGAAGRVRVPKGFATMDAKLAKKLQRAGGAARGIPTILPDLRQAVAV